MKFCGVVLGGDMNTYGVARAFYEEYGIKTIVLGKKPLFPTYPSKIIEGYYYPDILEDETLIKALKELDEKYPDTKKIMFGNTDFYVKHVMNNKEAILAISDNFIVPMVDVAIFEKLFAKATFYEMCEQYDLDYPRYQLFDFKTDDIDTYEVGFEYPVFAKPSDTVIYSNYEFPMKQKGYKVDSREELNKILTAVKEAGYDDKFIVQEYIEGNDETMFCFTAYKNTKGHVTVVTAGKILMHDRTPELIGNYSAITSAFDEGFSIKIKNFLEKIDFHGICHFDVQYDLKRQQFYVFEMNIRQGRSNLYTLASGANLMKEIVDDYIYGKDNEFRIADKQFTVSILPKSLLKYCLGKNGQKPDLTNFHRFGMVDYDKNMKRYMHQAQWDKRIFSGYMKYNK